jgi:hypothetical protein
LASIEAHSKDGLDIQELAKNDEALAKIQVASQETEEVHAPCVATIESNTMIRKKHDKFTFQGPFLIYFGRALWVF